ncbi:DNA-binding MarR family transcriptional regulator [Nocardiopsis arvandica]|uniref:DNA-binding MarR family transcriptional regulator n=1 Tax=Nocardiopsis sinuspersici TaxID=501010 RepID=A0A7Y9XCB1_9ACTN|nr:DNA-binding MarR family transcriptional regulator [Nocardiopsis sinuspersici]
MTDAVPEQIHTMVMDLVRTVGLLQPEHAVSDLTVSLSQGFALHELDTDPPLSQRELAERLGLEKSTVSRMVADMERKALLVRERPSGDRRSYRLRITGRGRAAHAAMAAEYHDHYVRWVAAMAPEERDAFLVGLPAFVRAVRRVRALDRAPDADADRDSAP